MRCVGPEGLALWLYVKAALPEQPGAEWGDERTTMLGNPPQDKEAKIPLAISNEPAKAVTAPYTLSWNRGYHAPPSLRVGALAQGRIPVRS